MSTESESRFDDVFNRFYTDIFRYCLRRLDHGEAEDATAEVFAVVWRRLDDMPEGAGTRAWLMSVAYHTVGNRYRGRRRRRRTTDYLAGLRYLADETPDQTLRMEEEKAVLQALSLLSPSDQELLRLDSWERLPIGYNELHDSLLPDVGLGRDDSHLIEDLDDLGELPLIVIGHDPEATFLDDGFLENPGATPEIASQINDFWQKGLDYYASLSTNSKREAATGSNHVVIWYRPDVVVDAVRDMLQG